MKRTIAQAAKKIVSQKNYILKLKDFEEFQKERGVFVDTKKGQDIKDFLAWMNRNKICSVIPFFAIQDGRDGKVPHWTDGDKLYDANELYEYFITDNRKA